MIPGGDGGAALVRARGRSMERMSGDTTTDSAPSPKPLLTLLNAPDVDDSDDDRPASQCCGGGSCSL